MRSSPAVPLLISSQYEEKTLKEMWLKRTAAVLSPEGVPFWHKFVSLIDGEFGDGGQELQPSFSRKGKSAALVLPGIAFNLNQHGALIFCDLYLSGVIS